MTQTKTSVGYLLPTREVVMAQATPDCGPIVQLAERAEALGFDSVWVGDSILARPRLEPLTTLAAAASRTSRVKLGTAVLLPALRHPVVLANELANLDLLCNGRLILGLGIAGNNSSIEREFTACGVDFRHRIGIFEEGVALMRRLWTEPEVTFHGRHFHLEGVRLGLRPAQSRAYRCGSPEASTTRYAGCFGWATAGSRCRRRRSRSPATGSGWNPWGRRWGKTRASSPGPCTSRST